MQNVLSLVVAVRYYSSLFRVYTSTAGRSYLFQRQDYYYILFIQFGEYLPLIFRSPGRSIKNNNNNNVCTSLCYWLYFYYIFVFVRNRVSNKTEMKKVK